MLAIAIFFVLHWQISVFFQSFFQHRYAAHGQFRMSKRAERVVHFLAWFTQGSSYLTPRAYAWLHRAHHAYSDTDKDPHSPVVQPNFFIMMKNTHAIYRDLKNGTTKPEPRFDTPVPYWPLFDKHLAGWTAAIAWGTIYGLFYLHFATAWWQWLFLPLQWYMGPIHGAIVNYFGHKLGYRNFKSTDNSKNTLPFDVLTMGELFQNNHHEFAMSPNFGGARKWEIDPAYQIMKVLHWMKVIDMSGAQKMRLRPEKKLVAKPVAQPVLPIEPSPTDAE